MCQQPKNPIGVLLPGLFISLTLFLKLKSCLGAIMDSGGASSSDQVAIVTSTSQTTAPYFLIVWTAKDYLRRSAGVRHIRSSYYTANFPNCSTKWLLELRRWKCTSSLIEYVAANLFLMELVHDSVPMEVHTRGLPVRLRMSMVIANGNEHVGAGGYVVTVPRFQVGNGAGYEAFAPVNLLEANSQRLLPWGNLVIKCQIWVEHEADACGSIQQLNLLETEKLATEIGALFMNGTNADVQIQVDDRSLPAHKCVLAARSAVFAGMFAHQLAENVNNRVTITDFNEDIVKTMLKFIYTGNLDHHVVISKGIDLFRIAHKYDIQGLRRLCEENISVNIDLENALDVLVLGHVYSSVAMKDRALQYIKGFKSQVMRSEAFHRVSSTLPSGVFIELFLEQLH